MPKTENYFQNNLSYSWITTFFVKYNRSEVVALLGRQTGRQTDVNHFSGLRGHYDGYFSWEPKIGKTGKGTFDCQMEGWIVGFDCYCIFVKETKLDKSLFPQEADAKILRSRRREEEEGASHGHKYFHSNKDELLSLPTLPPWWPEILAAGLIKTCKDAKTQHSKQTIPRTSPQFAVLHNLRIFNQWASPLGAARTLIGSKTSRDLELWCYVNSLPLTAINELLLWSWIRWGTRCRCTLVLRAQKPRSS